MARLTISLPDNILDELKSTKPAYRPMSQHVVELLVSAIQTQKEKSELIAQFRGATKIELQNH